MVIKFFFKEIVADSTTKVKKNKRSEREQKNVIDDLEKNAAVRNRHAVEKKPEVHKTDERACAEVILSAHALVTEIVNQRWSGMYLKEIESREKKVPEMQRTQKFADWVREKKNNFSKMFARYRSNKQ